jgi:MFS family permease
MQIQSGSKLAQKADQFKLQGSTDINNTFPKSDQKPLERDLRNIAAQPSISIELELSPNKLSKAENTSPKNSKCIFVLFLFTNLFLNFDTGVIPASLIQIEAELKIDYTQQAAMGSLVYLGLSLASVFVSPCFKKYRAKNVVAVSIVINSIFCGLLSWSRDLYIIYACRLMMGFSQAFSVIYGPVWVNEFSPVGSSTMWMGILHSFVALGIMLGYMVAAMTNTYLPKMFSWRTAIAFQALMEIPIAIAFCFQPNKFVDVLDDQKPQKRNESMLTASPNGKGVRIDTIDLDNYQTVWQQVKVILGNKLLVLMTLALCSLYYVVTGIQFWSTTYLIKIIALPPQYSMISFGIICISAPLCGVFIGGYASDKLGGYKGNNLVSAVKLCLVFSISALLIAMPTGYVNNPILFLPLLWTLIFFGACIIPTATGIIVDSVSREYQAACSAFSQLLYNVLGYFLSPILSAVVMDHFSTETQGLTWGFRFLLSISLFGVIFISIAWYDVHTHLQNYLEMKDEVEDVFNVHALSKNEVKLEVTRRRAISLM